MVCVSGGKDSYAHARHPAEPAATRADRLLASSRSTSTRSSPTFPEHVLPEYLASRGVRVPHREPGHLLHRHQARGAEGKTMCSLCSRLRRDSPVPRGRRAGSDQDRARPPPRRHAAARVFLNMFFGSQAQGHAPQAGQRRRQEHVVIRPLAYVPEHRPGSAGPRTASSPSSPARCAAARRTCSASRSRRCCATGRSQHPGRLDNMARRAGQRGAHRTCRTGTSTPSTTLQAHRKWPTRLGDKAFDDDEDAVRTPACASVGHPIERHADADLA